MLRHIPNCLSVYRTMLRHIPNCLSVYHNLLRHIPNCLSVSECFCPEFIKHICLSYAFNTKDKHKVYIFLVSVTGMYLNQLDKIVNALWNISHTTILECEVPFVSRCTNLVLWIVHFCAVGDKCTDGHKIKLYWSQTVSVCKNNTQYSCCCCCTCCIIISLFYGGVTCNLKRPRDSLLNFPNTFHCIAVPQCCTADFAIFHTVQLHLPSHKIWDAECQGIITDCNWSQTATQAALLLVPHTQNYHKWGAYSERSTTSTVQ